MNRTEQQGSGERRSSMRIRWYGVLAAVACTGLLAAGFLHARGTPHYSLYMLKSAIENRDAATVLRYVDVDMIIDHLAQDLLAAQPESRPSDPWEALASGLAKGSLRGMLPSLKESVKGQIVTQILAVDDELLGHLRRVSVFALAVERDGNQADAFLRDDPSRRIRMTKTPEGHWRVVRIIHGGQ